MFEYRCILYSNLRFSLPRDLIFALLTFYFLFASIWIRRIVENLYTGLYSF